MVSLDLKVKGEGDRGKSRIRDSQATTSGEQIPMAIYVIGERPEGKNSGES